MTSTVAEGLTFSHPPLRTTKRFRIRRERPLTANAVEERQIFKICLSVGKSKAGVIFRPSLRKDSRSELPSVGRESGPSIRRCVSEIAKASNQRGCRRPKLKFSPSKSGRRKDSGFGEPSLRKPKSFGFRSKSQPTPIVKIVLRKC